jgi:hypothetical protein
MFLVCAEDLRQAPRVRAVSDFVADKLAQHRAQIDPFA